MVVNLIIHMGNMFIHHQKIGPLAIWYHSMEVVDQPDHDQNQPPEFGTILPMEEFLVNTLYVSLVENPVKVQNQMLNQDKGAEV